MEKTSSYTIPSHDARIGGLEPRCRMQLRASTNRTGRLDPFMWNTIINAAYTTLHTYRSRLRTDAFPNIAIAQDAQHCGLSLHCIVVKRNELRRQ